MKVIASSEGQNSEADRNFVDPDNTITLHASPNVKNEILVQDVGGSNLVFIFAS